MTLRPDPDSRAALELAPADLRQIWYNAALARAEDFAAHCERRGDTRAATIVRDLLRIIRSLRNG